MAGRYRWVVAHDEPEIIGYDQDLWVARLHEGDDPEAMLALFEELIFRNNTSGWVTGLLWGGLAFGLLHLISFVSIRMTLYLSLVGVCFVGLYMAGGLMAVFVVHASYNLLALALLRSGKEVQSFPEYGPERRGATLRAYTRYGSEPVRRHDSVEE